MTIYTREKNPEAWAAYKNAVALGRIFHPIGKNFRRFCIEALERRGKNVPFKQGPLPMHTLLDDLA
jgi:hypothetical protein